MKGRLLYSCGPPMRVLRCFCWKRWHSQKPGCLGCTPVLPFSSEVFIGNCDWGTTDDQGWLAGCWSLGHLLTHAPCSLHTAYPAAGGQGSSARMLAKSWGWLKKAQLRLPALPESTCTNSLTRSWGSPTSSSRYDGPAMRRGSSVDLASSASVIGVARQPA